MENRIQQPTGASYRLVIFSDSTVRTVPLVGDRWVVGRAEDCEVCLRDPTVSRRHIVIERSGDQFRFRDMGGANPALLDGKPTRTGVLAPGSTLMLGLTRITLDHRQPRVRVVQDQNHTVVVACEQLAAQAAARPGTRILGSRDLDPDAVTKVLECLEWPLADLGSIDDCAEPLLDLALNLTGRRRGTLGIFQPTGALRCLATIDRTDPDRELHLPAQLLRDVRAEQLPFLITHNNRGESVERLVVPLVPTPSGLLVLEDPRKDAPTGQEVLRLARAIGSVTTQRLAETEQRLRLREELTRLRFHGTSAHATVMVSNRLQEVRRQLRETTSLQLPVLLVGEAGTEKEDLARYLHSQSRDPGAAFVSFHCAAMPPHRAEDELFGNGRGHGGALAKAHGGTLYLERPELLPEHAQERLATTIREGRIDLGGAGVVPVHVRFVVGTDRPLAELAPPVCPSLIEVVGGLQFAVPPLRDDPRDVQALADLLLSEMGPDPDNQPRRLADKARQALLEYSWPGNVRELRIVLEAAAAKAGSDEIQQRHLPDAVREPNGVVGGNVLSLEEIEKRHVREVLARVGGSRQKAAALLGIAVSTLYEKVKRYNIDP